MKQETQRRRKHCALAVVIKAGPKDPLPGGAGQPKFGDGHYLHLQTQFGED